MPSSASVDGGDDPLAEAQEIRQRPVAVGAVPLQREVRAIELQQEAVRRRSPRIRTASARAERGEIGLLGRVDAGSARWRAMIPGEGAVRKASA